MKQINFYRYPIFIYLFVAAFISGSSSYLRTVFVFDNVMAGIQIFAFVLLFYNCVMTYKPSIYLKLLIAFFTVQLIPTVLWSKDMYGYIITVIQGLGATMLIEEGIRRSPAVLLDALRKVLMVLIVLNLVFMLLLPEGFSGADTQALYLLGIRIAFTPFMITAISCSMLYDLFVYKRMLSFFTIILLAIALLSLVIKNVSTGLSAVILFLLIVILAYTSKQKLFTFWKAVIFYAAIFVGIVFFSIQYDIPFFSYFLVDVLDKDLSFDYRTTIWSAAISTIPQHLFIGHGITLGGALTVDFTYQTRIITSHNQVLETLYEGGLLAFGLFLAMIFCIGKKIRINKAFINQNIIMAAVLSFFVIFLTEVQTSKALVFIIFALAYHLEEYNIERIELRNRFRLKTNLYTGANRYKGRGVRIIKQLEEGYDK